MTEYSRMAKGTYTVSGGTLGVSAPNAKIIPLPFKPDFVELINYTQATVPANHGIPYAKWDANAPNVVIAGPTTITGPLTVVNVFTAATVLTTDTVSPTGGISAFSGGLSLQYGSVVQHGGSPVSDFSISKANPAVVTTVGNHGLSSGDVVVFSNLSQTSTTGMQQIAGIAFTVTKTGATTFTIPWDTSGTAYTVFDTSSSTNNVGSYKKVLYPYLYAPGVSIISGITNGSTTTIDTTTAHNLVVGQEVAIRIPSVTPSTVQQWGPTQLNALPNTTIPGSPIYGYVVAVTDYNTVVVNINSTGYTAFSANIPFSSYSGLSYCQLVAVGDVNTGGVQISSGSALYPPPYTTQIGTTKTNSINGPALLGSYINNTQQGFIIGNGASRTDTSSWVGGSDGDIIEWRAYLHDMVLSS